MIRQATSTIVQGNPTVTESGLLSIPGISLPPSALGKNVLISPSITSHIVLNNVPKTEAGPSFSLVQLWVKLLPKQALDPTGKQDTDPIHHCD
jgi:hypothetical protein